MPCELGQLAFLSKIPSLYKLNIRGGSLVNHKCTISSACMLYILLTEQSLVGYFQRR